MSHSNPLRVVIIDDEGSAIRALTLLISKFCPELTLIGSAQDPIEGIKLIKEQRPDLVFLDVEMPEKTGFELLDSFESIDFDVVFTTAFDTYAIRAIRYAALDYLLKPIDLMELKEVVKRRLQRENKPQKETFQLAAENFTKGEERQIVLPTLSGYLFKEVASILRLEAENNYTRFIFKDGSEVLVSKTLKSFQELLPKQQFFRANRSHLIRISEIRELRRAKHSSLVMNDRTEISISTDKKAQLFSYMLSL